MSCHSDIIKFERKGISCLGCRERSLLLTGFCFAQSSCHLFYSFRFRPHPSSCGQVLYPFESIDPSDKMPTFRYVNAVEDMQYRSVWEWLKAPPFPLGSSLSVPALPLPSV